MPGILATDKSDVITAYNLSQHARIKIRSVLLINFSVIHLAQLMLPMLTVGTERSELMLATSAYSSPSR